MSSAHDDNITSYTLLLVIHGIIRLVIPAKAGIHANYLYKLLKGMDSALRRNDRENFILWRKITINWRNKNVRTI